MFTHREAAVWVVKSTDPEPGAGGRGGGRQSGVLGELGSLQLRFNTHSDSGRRSCHSQCTEGEMGIETHVCPQSQQAVRLSASRDWCDSKTHADRGLAHPARVALCPVGWGFS